MNISKKIKAKQIDLDSLRDSNFVQRLVFTATIKSANWVLDSSTGVYSQSITVNGILNTDRPYIYPTASNNSSTDIAIMEIWGNIFKVTTGINNLLVYSTQSSLPIDIPITIEVFR